MDSLCVEAVDGLLKMVEMLGDLQAPPPCDDTCEALTKTQTGGGEHSDGNTGTDGNVEA